MDQDEELRQLTQQKAPASMGREPWRLGALVCDYMTKQIEPTQQRMSVLRAVWAKVVPPRLRSHCRAAELVKGELKILVDGPVYLYQLRVLAVELLTDLRKTPPARKVRKLTFALGDIGNRKKH